MLDIYALVQRIKLVVPTAKVQAHTMSIDPDQMVTLTDFSGTSMLLDDSIDVPHVQVLCRSNRLNGRIARDNARAIDAFFNDDTLRPYLLGDARLLSSGRVGGGPGYLKTDDQNRVIYLCNYWLKIQR